MSQKSTIIFAITLTNTLIKHPDCYQWSQKSSEVFSDSQTKSHFHFQSYCFHCASLIYYSLFTKYRQVLCGLCNHTVKWFVSFLCGSLDCNLGNPSFRVCVAFGWGLCIPWVCVSLNYGYLYSLIWVCIYAILYSLFEKALRFWFKKDGYTLSIDIHQQHNNNHTFKQPSHSNKTLASVITILK